MTERSPEEHKASVNAAADAIRDLCDDELLTAYRDDQVAFALMMNTARIVGGKIVSQAGDTVSDVGEMYQAMAGDFQKVALRYLRRHGIGIKNEQFADVGDGSGGVDKFKLRAEVDNAVEELEESVGELCAYYGGQLVSGAMFAVLGNLASDALVMYRETQGAKVKIPEANALMKATTDACHRAYIETLKAHGVPIISVDLTKTPPKNPEHN